MKTSCRAETLRISPYPEWLHSLVQDYFVCIESEFLHIQIQMTSDFKSIFTVYTWMDNFELLLFSNKEIMHEFAFLFEQCTHTHIHSNKVMCIIHVVIHLRNGYDMYVVVNRTWKMTIRNKSTQIIILYFAMPSNGIFLLWLFIAKKKYVAEYHSVSSTVPFSRCIFFNHFFFIYFYIACIRCSIPFITR